MITPKNGVSKTTKVGCGAAKDNGWDPLKVQKIGQSSLSKMGADPAGVANIQAGQAWTMAHKGTKQPDNRKAHDVPGYMRTAK